MTKKRKVLLSLVIITILSIAFMLFLDSSGVFKKIPNDPQYVNKQIDDMKNSWEIKIDGKYEIVYHKISDLSFRGDGLKYFVISLEKNSQISQTSLSQTKSDTFEEEFNEAINIEDDYQNKPDFNKEYNWKKVDKDNDSLFLVYFPDTLELCILESKI